MGEVTFKLCFCSVTESYLTIWLHGLQHARVPCSSPYLGLGSNAFPLSQWCCLTISSSIVSFFLLPSIFPSIMVFSSESAVHIRWPKYWSFSFSISPSNEYSGLISFRIDWFELLAVQGNLESLLQHYNSKESIIWHAVFFMCQLSNLYIIIGETIASTTEAFVRKRMSSPLNMISMFVVAFFPKSKYLLMSWLQSPSTVILEPPQNKICNSFHFSPFCLLWSDETKCHDLSFFNVSFKLASFFTLLFHPQQEALYPPLAPKGAL